MEKWYIHELEKEAFNNGNIGMAWNGGIAHYIAKIQGMPSHAESPGEVDAFFPCFSCTSGRAWPQKSLLARGMVMRARERITTV